VRRLSLLVLVGIVWLLPPSSGTRAAASATSEAATPLPSSACGSVFYKGSGSRRTWSLRTTAARGGPRPEHRNGEGSVRPSDSSYHFKVGKYTSYQACDDSTAQDGRVGCGQVHVERQGLCREQVLPACSDSTPGAPN